MERKRERESEASGERRGREEREGGRKREGREEGEREEGGEGERQRQKETEREGEQAAKHWPAASKCWFCSVSCTKPGHQPTPVAGALALTPTDSKNTLEVKLKHGGFIIVAITTCWNRALMVHLWSRDLTSQLGSCALTLPVQCETLVTFILYKIEQVSVYQVQVCVV